jgi:hypothetical protein
MPKRNNPIVEMYKGIEVRKYTQICIWLSPQEFKELIDVQSETGFSNRAILSYTSRPCHKCENIPVIAFDKDGNEFKIKRGILSRRIPEPSGVNLINHAKAHRNSKENK